MASAQTSERPSGRIRLLRDAALSSGAQYVESMVGLIIGVLIARALGPTDYGHYAFAVWMCGWMLRVSNNGLPMASIRLIAEARGHADNELARTLVGAFGRLQGVCTVVVLTVFVVVASLYPPAEWGEALGWMILLSCIAVWARGSFWMRGSIGKAYERFEPENFALLGTTAVNFLAVGLWWAFDRSVLGAFAIYAGCGMVCLWISIFLLHRFDIRSRSARLPAATREHVGRTVLFTGALMGIELVGNRTLETVLLKAYWPADVLGYFVIAGSLTKGAVDLFTGGLAAILLPAMSRSFGESGQPRVGQMMVESIRYYWWIGLLVAGLGIMVVPGMVSLLYGSRYAAAVPAVMWMLVIAALGAFSGALSAFQMASDLQSDRILSSIGGVAVNVVAAIALVPPLGLDGAILSLAITRIGGLAIQTELVRRRIGLQWKWGAMGRLLGAAALACALTVPVELGIHGRFSFIGSGLLYTVLFMTLSIVFKAWYRSDFVLIGEISRRFGAVGARFASLCDRLGARFAI